MKIVLIGTARQPTLNVGSNGLGRHTYDFLEKLSSKNDQIITFLHKDSQIHLDNITQLYYQDEFADVQSLKNFIEVNKPDIIWDFSHFHLLSKIYNNENLSIINFIHDEECDYNPPNCMIGNEWQKKKYNNSKIFTTGINVDKYPFFEKKENYFSFCGKLENRKGYDIAYTASKAAGVKTIFAGPDVEGNAKYLENWIGEITNHNQFCEFVGKSKCLFYPSRSEAGGLAIWEAMALGTPTITISGTGTQCNIIHGVTGYIANSFEEITVYINKVNELDPHAIRKICEEKWDFNKNFEIIYQQLINFYKGERW